MNWWFLIATISGGALGLVAGLVMLIVSHWLKHRKAKKRSRADAWKSQDVDAN